MTAHGRQRTFLDYTDLVDLPSVTTLIELALHEDLADRGDVTSLALMPDAPARFVFRLREPGIVAGLDLVAAVFRKIDRGVRCEKRTRDGESLPAGAELLVVEGRAVSILSGERTALNFLQRLSAIATETRRYVDEVAEWGTMILDTRKTTPGWRVLEKYAVHCGGGTNHRVGLFDQILIKDNHLAHWVERTGKGIADAVQESRQQFPDLSVEVEADTPDQVDALLLGKPDWILLDNMTNVEMRSCVERCKGTSLTEASGGITFERLREVAATGVDAISVGAITHSVSALDIGLDAWEPAE